MREDLSVAERLLAAGGVAYLCGGTPICIGAGIIGGIGAGLGFDELVKPRVFQRFSLDPVDSLELYNP